MKNPITQISHWIKNHYDNHYSSITVGENGNHIVSYKDGSKYEGQWKNGQRNGEGVIFYNNGEKEYEGHWKDDQRHGEGVEYFYMEKIKKYEGGWKEGKKHGNGVLYNSKGMKRYEGQWKDGYRHGSGALYFDKVEKKRYEGEWEKGFPCGQGIQYYKNGQIEYEGIFDHRFYGDGNYYDKQGEVLQDQWKGVHVSFKGKLKHRTEKNEHEFEQKNFIKGHY